MVLKIAQSFFDTDKNLSRNHHDSYYGVKTHENGQFLYKSNQADSLLRSRMMDYLMFAGLAGLISGQTPLILVPLLVATLSWPRKIAIVNYFAFHAELLPHTEQVVFHKVGLFGNVRRIHVDVKNLEKIDASLVPSKLFDSSYTYRPPSLVEQLVRLRYGL